MVAESLGSSALALQFDTKEVDKRSQFSGSRGLLEDVYKYRLAY